jgi:hypothetical protein
MIDAITAQDAAYADAIFLHPDPQYRYEDIILGTKVRFSDGSSEQRKVFASNTSRAFTKIDKGAPGAAEIYDQVVLEERQRILRELDAATSRESISSISEWLRGAIIPRLTNIKPDRLKSFNRTRKPVDLYLMNLVAMGKEFASCRDRLVPLLHLPLDAQMLSKVFDSPTESFGTIETQHNYEELQDRSVKLAKWVSKRIGRPFYPIYFELLWRDRIARQGTNLFNSGRMRNE